MARLLGYQLANLKGENIQGGNEDPTNLPSFGVLAPHVATHIMRQIGSCKFLLMPIYEGDIENPELVEHP